jgi:acetyl esterase/lipase
METAPPYPDIAAEIRAIGSQIEVARTSQLYRTLHPVNPPTQVVITRNLRYGPHERHVLDIFVARDADRTLARPIVVFVHGGGFRAGGKQLPDQPFHDNVGVWAARAGLVGVTISYRLAPEFVYPAGVEDLERVTAQIRALARDCGGNPAQLFLWGHSAGAAHVADYMVTRPDVPLAGAILTSGIYDKSGGAPDSPWSIYYGADSSRYDALSSLPGLATTRVPLLVTWAELDRADFVADAQALVRARQGAGRPVSALQLPGHSHLSEIYAIGTADTSLSAPVLDFIHTVNEGQS